MGERNTKKGEICLMGEKKEDLNDFSAIVKKAYDRGKSDHGLTVEKLLDELKNDLKKLTV